MEVYIPISFLNDFIFCPRSIYFHQLYSGYAKTLYDDIPQVAGKLAHGSVDENRYSTRKSILQGIEVYSHRYNLGGKIDTFDLDTGELRERKRKIKTIYDGYVFQLYAQYYALTDMGYRVSSLSLYSMADNHRYPVSLPEEDMKMKEQFIQLLADLRGFSLEDRFTPNPEKCRRCIYSQLCDKAAL